MLDLIWGCLECDKYETFNARKRTPVKNVLRRAASLHRMASPRCKNKAKDLLVCSEFEAHCFGMID